MDTGTGSILPSSHQPNRILRDVPSLPRIVITVPVIIQPRLLIVLLTRQPYHLLQVRRVFLTRQVSPLTIFPHVDKFILRRQIYLKYQISHAYRLCTMRNIEPTYLEYMEHDLLPIFLYFFPLIFQPHHSIL